VTQAPFDLTAGLAGHLKLEFREITPDRVVLTWIVGPQHHQPYGIVHGGVHCAAIETAASVAAAAWFGDRGNVVGVSNQTDFLRGVREGELTATATPVHRGRLQQLWLVEITDADGRLVARGQVRLQNLEDASRLGRSASSAEVSRSDSH
jgi:uncharacterized protein (TIGR00369 family)